MFVRSKCRALVSQEIPADGETRIPAGVETRALWYRFWEKRPREWSPGDVHTLTCCTHFFVRYIHCAYTSHMHGSRVSAVRMSSSLSLASVHEPKEFDKVTTSRKTHTRTLDCSVFSQCLNPLFRAFLMMILLFK